MDLDIEYISNLSYPYVLPVARGLIALILCNSANVDMFLLACKVNKLSHTHTIICNSFLTLVLFIVKYNINFHYVSLLLVVHGDTFINHKTCLFVPS